MKFGREMMNSIVEKIYTQELSYTDQVVIGDNSSGKTLLLRLFMEWAGKDSEIYFIDTVNRGFDVKKVSRTERTPEFKKTILGTRLQEDYFNLRDSFNCFGTLTERVEMIYYLYEKEIQDLFYEITDTQFKILEDNPFGEVEFKEGKGLLSSGYQAMIRILLELLYYQDMEIEKKSIASSWVVIDEIDEFLSPRFSAAILEFLKKKFPWGRWLVTTHSCDLVANTNEANLIVLEDGNCEVLDINDYSSVSEVQIVFDRIFGNYPRQELQVEHKLRRLLNNRINQAWGEKDEECLCQLEREKLTASQKMIIRQIREW